MDTNMPAKQKEANENSLQQVGESLLTRVIKSNPEITVDSFNNEGDVFFSVPIKSLGVTPIELGCWPTVRTSFFVNFLGEYLVRKNIHLFTEMLFNIPTTTYDSLVNNFSHRNFGMMTSPNGNYVFQFHISLVQEILTEDFGKVFDQ